MTEPEKGKSVGNGGPKGREFYVELAKNPRSRVIMANTGDTFMMTDIVRQGDIIISRLRDSLMRSVSVEEFTEYMDEYYKIIFSLEDHLGTIGKKVGVKYRKSRTYREASDRGEKELIETPDPVQPAS